MTFNYHATALLAMVVVYKQVVVRPFIANVRMTITYNIVAYIIKQQQHVTIYV